MTTEQQRKMLECAAKACGLTGKTVVFGKNDFTYHRNDGHVFNPLTHPHDTAWMCAKLRISTLYEHDPCEFLSCFAHNSHDPEIAYYKDLDNSSLKAWMYAATLVAAKTQGYEA